MQIKYVSARSEYHVARTDLSKAYDFVKGVAQEVEDKDGARLIELAPASFQEVKDAPQKKKTKKKSAFTEEVSTEDDFFD